MPLRVTSAIVAWAVVALTGAATRTQPAPDEPDPALTASELLEASQLRGPNHTVQDAVRTPGDYHLFTIASPLGSFEANGKSQVAVRISEIAALASLQELNKAGVFARAAGESLVKVGSGVVSAVTDPVDTAKGIGSGVKRLGVNLGRRTKRAVQSVTSDDRKPDTESTSAGDKAANAAKGLVGITGARRRWAERVGADPYTTNPVLRDALDRVASVDVAGGIATKIALPIPVLVSTTAKVGNLVWSSDPEALRKLNEQRAREIGASSEGASAFFRNGNFTLTMQTRLVAALHAVNRPGIGDYLASAAEADGERDALFFVESAELLQAHHQAAPVASVLTDSRALVARMPTGEAVALLPLDWVRRSESFIAQARQLAERAQAELGATSLRLVVSGQVSEAAARDLAAIGWRR